MVATASKKRKARGAKLLGSTPPGWGALRWLNRTPMRLTSLHGKAVLVRWWTDACPTCAATVPALNQLHHEFADEGLVVVGMYFPNPPRPVNAAAVKETMRELHIEFPVAIDFDWGVLRRWWLDTGKRNDNAVTFLLDRQGRTRMVHPGHQYCLEGDEQAVDDYKAIRTKVRRILSAKQKA